MLEGQPTPPLAVALSVATRRALGTAAGRSTGSGEGGLSVVVMPPGRELSCAARMRRAWG